MVDRRARELAACLLVAEARRASALACHARALRDEMDATARAADALQRRVAATDAWQAQIRGAFDPALGSALGGVLIAATDQERASTEHRTAAGAARAEHAACWRNEDARCIRSRALVADHTRHAARTRDDRTLVVLADRITFDWSQR